MLGTPTLLSRNMLRRLLNEQKGDVVAYDSGWVAGHEERRVLGGDGRELRS